MNVLFKRGHQQALDALTTFAEGAFYLTDDTNRLYFAQTNNKLVDLNQYIHIVTELPTSASDPNLKRGDFYYIESHRDTNNNLVGNVLAVYDGTGWVQINPDTKLASTNSAVSISAETENGKNVAVVTTTITDRNAYSASYNTATGNFGIKEGSNVHVTVDQNNNIIISADNDTTNTTYTITTIAGANVGTIRLTGTDSSTQDISITGTGDVKVSSDANGAITISGAPKVTSVTNGFDANGAFTTDIGTTDAGNPINSNSITPTITYGNNNTSSATFNNGTAALSVYTKTEVEEKISQAKRDSALMAYKGSINSSNAATELGDSTRTVGDTYLASSVITSPVSAQPGDLIVAKSNAAGTGLEWEVIPAGNDQFVEIVGSSANKNISFTDGFHNHDLIGDITFEEDNDNTASKINIDVTTEQNDDSAVNVKITHGAAGTGVAVDIPTDANATVQNTNTDLYIPTITSLSKDKHGHITNITTGKFKLKDTHAELHLATQNVEKLNSSNTGKYTFGYYLDQSSGDALYVDLLLTSDNLNISVPQDSTDNNTLKINLEWGNF